MALTKKEINRRWYLKHQEKNIEKSRAKYQKNKDQHLRTCREWQRKNKGRIKAKRREYLEKNAGKIRTQSKERRVKSLEKYRETERKRWIRNKEKISIRRKQRRENKKLEPIFKKMALRREWEYHRMWDEENKRVRENLSANINWVSRKTKKVSMAKKCPHHPWFS
jgi:hypothetical protein